MLENPQCFVFHANGLQIGRRINPLSADEDLDFGHLYFLLPMAKLHSVLSQTDMAALEFKANSTMKANRRRSSDVRIRPLFGELMRFFLPKMKKDSVFFEEGNQNYGAQDPEQLSLPKLNLGDYQSCQWRFPI